MGTGSNLVTNPILMDLDFSGNSIKNLGEDGITSIANIFYFNKSINIENDKSYYISDNEVLSWNDEGSGVEIPANLNIVGEISIDGVPLEFDTGEDFWSSSEGDYIYPLNEQAINIQSDQGYFQNENRILKVTNSNTFLGIERPVY